MANLKAKLLDNINTIILSVIVMAIGGAYTKFEDFHKQLATKDDLQQQAKIANFKWAESNIKINELILASLDRTAQDRDLAPAEQRQYEAVLKSTERITKLQEALLNESTNSN